MLDAAVLSVSTKTFKIETKITLEVPIREILYLLKFVLVSSNV